MNAFEGLRPPHSHFFRAFTSCACYFLLSFKLNNSHLFIMRKLSEKCAFVGYKQIFLSFVLAVFPLHSKLELETYLLVIM